MLFVALNLLTIISQSNLMKKIIACLSLLCGVLSSNAQTTQYTCASAEYLKSLDQQFPGLQANVEKITEHANYRSRGTTVTIPVVFHVVYNTTQQNLADAYLTSQIDMLNQCYARTNADTQSMRAIYKSRVGPSKIRFVLDQTIRVSTSTTSFDASSMWGFSGSDAVKKTSNGGSDPVSPDKKLNVWICNLTIDGSDGLIGYAYPPAGAPNWPVGSSAPAGMDGVIIDFTDIGGISKHPLGYSNGFRGKALVHEIGHYLGLRHIWGDDGGACHTDTGFKDDGLSDTPEAADATSFNCDKTVNSCTEATGDLPDMKEDYMDYSSASCQNSFTKMQVSAMEYVLDNIRVNVRVPVGINSIESISKNIVVYPNPVSEILYVQIQHLDFQTANITFTNAIGQQIFSRAIEKTNEPIEFNTSTFAKGIYFMNIQMDNQSSVSKKIMIQ